MVGAASSTVVVLYEDDELDPTKDGDFDLLGVTTKPTVDDTMVVNTTNSNNNDVLLLIIRTMEGIE